MANNKGNQNTKPNFTSYSSPIRARATSDSACYKCFVARDSSCQGKRDLPNQGNLPCLDNHDKHTHLDTGDSSNQINPSHIDSHDSSNQDNPSDTGGKGASNQVNPSHTQSKESPNQVNPLHIDRKDSSKNDYHSHTYSKDSSNKINPSVTDRTNSSGELNPSHTDNKDSSNQDIPSQRDSKDSSNKINPSVTDRTNSSGELNPSHTDNKDSSNQDISSQRDSKDSSNKINPSITDSKDSSDQVSPSHTHSKDSSNQDIPSQRYSKDSSNQINPLHTDSKDSPNQDIPSDADGKNSSNQVNPSHTESKESTNQANPLHIDSKDSSNNNYPSHTHSKDSSNQDIPSQRDSKDSSNKINPSITDSKDLSDQVNPTHTHSKDSSNQDIPSQRYSKDSSNQINPSDTDSRDLSNQVNPSCTCSKDSSNQDTPSQRDSKGSSNQVNPSHTDSKDSSNQINPSDTDSKHLSEQVNPSHTDSKDSSNQDIPSQRDSKVYLLSNQVNPSHTDRKDSSNQDIPSQRDSKVYLISNQVNPSHTDSKDSLNQDIASQRDSKDSLNQINPSHTDSKDPPNQDMPSQRDIRDSSNQMNPLVTDSKDSSNQVNLSHTDSKDSSNQDAPSQTDGKDSSDKDNHQHQYTEDSLILATSHPGVSSLSNLDKTNQPYVKDGAVATEPISDIVTTNNTSDLEESELGNVSKTIHVTLHEGDSGTDTNNDKSLTNEGIKLHFDISMNDGHNKAVLPEPSMRAEQKTNSFLQLTKLEAKLISHNKVQEALILVFYKRQQIVQFHPAKGFIEIQHGDQTIVKEIMASEICTEKIAVDKDEQTLDDRNFSPYLVKTYDPRLRQITIVFLRKIEEKVLPIINHLKLSSCCCIFPLCMTTYTRSYLTQIVEMIQKSCFPFKVPVDVEVIKGSSHFKITTEKTKFDEVKSTVDHLLKTIQIKKMVLTPHGVNRILSSQGQQYLMQLEEKHKCQINVVSSDHHVFMRASCPSGHKLFMMEGTMATADCQILVLPLCDGQKQWPSQHKSILEKSFLTTDIVQYGGVRTPPTPNTLSLECNGEAKGQTVVVMYIPSKNFNDSIAKACEIMLSEISGKSTIAMPLELSTDISYKESLPVILRVIREHTLRNENKPFSVFFYAGDQTLQTLQEITGFVETLLDKEEKFPPWKTNILPLGPYHRVKIMEADLEKVKADVIVNSTDPGLLHTNGAVSNALLKAAGPEMAVQCQELYPGGIGNRTVVTTDSFHLGGVKAIFHIVLPQETWSHIPKTGAEELRSRVKACLMEATVKKYESIAFPALGVGRLEYPPDIVAQTMFTAATDFFLRMPESTVENVYFVCHPQHKKAVKAFKAEEQKQKKKLQRSEEEQNECKEYLLSLGDYKLLVIKNDAQRDPILTNVIIIASGSQASTVTDYQRNNSENSMYIQTRAKHIQHVFKSCVDFKQRRSVGIILDTFDDKCYCEILNAVDREIAEKSNLHFILYVQDKQKLDVLQKLTGGKCEPIQVEKKKKANKEKTDNKEGMIHICGPKDEIEEAMLQLKKMLVSIPSNQRPDIPKDQSNHPKDNISIPIAQSPVTSQNQSVRPEDVPLPQEIDGDPLENSQQLMHDICKLIMPNSILKPYLHNFLALTDVHIVPNPTGSTEFHIKCDSIEKAKAGIQDIFQQISNVTEHSSSLTKSEESESFIKEIDCLAYEALEYIFGDKFTFAFNIQSRNTNKVTIQTPSIKVKQALEEKISSLRQEDVPLSSQEMAVLGNSVDVKSENIDVFIKLMHDQNKAILFGCDYNAVTKAKHLILVKCGRTKLTNRGKRQFAAGSGDPICNQIPMQNTGATSPGIGYAKDFDTKSGIKISVYKADITQLTVDAIVNAANENLGHGGGVAFAIAKAAGPDLEVEGDEYIRKFGPLKVSDIVKTKAGRLPCKAVLHAVGPRWDDYQNKEECKQALQQTVYNCLRKSHDLNYTSLAVTSISSAIFGVPKAICADSYLAALQSFEQHYGRKTNLQHIHFVDISDEMICIIQDTFKEKWDTPVVPNYVQQSFGGGLKLKSGDGIASESSSVTLGKTEKEPAYQYNFSHLSIIVKQQHISETDADVIVLWQEPGKPFDDTTSQQVLKATGKQLLAKEMAILKHKLVSGSGQIEMLTTSKDQLIVLPVMTSFIMDTNDVFTLMEKVFNMIDIAKGKFVAISSLPYLTRQKESNSSSKDLEEFTAGLCMAVLNYVKKSDGPVNCIYIYAENVEVFRVMVHVINVKIREYESSSRLLNEAGIKQSYSDPINKNLPTCKICLDEIVNSKTLSCGHTFCEKCINRWFNIQKVCPCCKSAQGLLTGNQPVDGKMEIKRQPFSLKGFDSKDCFKIVYSFPPGKQSEEHPNPGKHYSGTKREAYIPNTAEGRKVLMLLKVAFDRRLVFTVGTSATSGCNDTIIWNGIHHKTSVSGGIEYHGYPDDTYLTRVQQELKDMGVTVKDLSEEQKDFIQHPRHVYKYIV